MVSALCLCLPLPARAETWIPEAWIQSGWQQIASGHHRQALSIWQQGVNQIPDRQLLASIGVYAHFPYALAQLKQVGPSYDAFIIRHKQRESVLYYVLSARRVPSSLSKRQRLLGDLKRAAGISDTLLAIEAKKLKTETLPTDHFSTPARKSMPPTTAITATAAANFSINRFDISGNRHLSTDAILISLSDFYGPGKKHSDLTSIRNQVMETYHRAGIYSVRIAMPQLINDDTVQISIEEKPGQ